MQAPRRDGDRPAAANQPRETRYGKQIFRVLVLRQGTPGPLAQPFQAVAEVGHDKDSGITEQIAYKGCSYHGTVIVGNLCVDYDLRPIRCGSGKKCHVRSKKKEGNAFRLVKPSDFRNDRERRIVDYDAIFRIGKIFVIASRKERPHNRPPIDSRVCPYPVEHGCIYGCGGITVVRGLLRLEFLDEALVIFGNLFPCLAAGPATRSK